MKGDGFCSHPVLGKELRAAAVGADSAHLPVQAEDGVAALLQREVVLLVCQLLLRVGGSVEGEGISVNGKLGAAAPIFT